MIIFPVAGMGQGLRRILVSEACVQFKFLESCYGFQKMVRYSGPPVYELKPSQLTN